MRKVFTGSLLILVSGFILFILSCTQGSCFEETKSSIKATFYNDITHKPAAPDTLSLHGLNNDSLIYDRSLKVQPAIFQLKASALSSSFVITINGISDTLTAYYSNYPHFISKECGYTFYQHLDTIMPYTHFHIIKSIEYTNKTISNLNGENIKIFY